MIHGVKRRRWLGETLLFSHPWAIPTAAVCVPVTVTPHGAWDGVLRNEYELTAHLLCKNASSWSLLKTWASYKKTKLLLQGKQQRKVTGPLKRPFHQTRWKFHPRLAPVCGKR